MDIHLNPKVGRDWTLRGRRRVVVTPGNNQKRYVAGAMSAKSGKVTWVKGTSKANSHGCIRLTNWDALDLAAAVEKGVVVTFVE